MSYEIQIRQLERQDTAFVRATCRWDEIGAVLSGIFAEVTAQISASGAQPTGGAFGRYTPGETEVGIEAGFTIATPIVSAGRVEAGELPGGEAAVCLHVGPYDAVAAAYEAIETWIREQGREASGAAWEVYLTGPEVQPPRTEVVFPLRPK
jgi:effector-binding domain-containing protein